MVCLRLGDRALNALTEEFGSECSFFQVVEGPTFEGFDYKFLAAEIRQHQHGAISRQSSTSPLCEELHTIQIREPIIEQDAFRRGSVEKPQAHLGRVGFYELIRLLLIDRKKAPVKL